MKGRVLHNALFTPEDDLNRIGFHDNRGSMMFEDMTPERMRRRNEVREDPIIPNNVAEGYDITLVPDELSANIMDEGRGMTPAPGQYITLMEKIYYQGETYDLRRGKATYLYGRNKNPLGLELFFGMIKVNMKARVQFGPNFTKKFNFPTSKTTENALIRADIKIIDISNFP